LTIEEEFPFCPFFDVINGLSVRFFSPIGVIAGDRLVFFPPFRESGTPLPAIPFFQPPTTLFFLQLLKDQICSGDFSFPFIEQSEIPSAFPLSPHRKYNWQPLYQMP